MKSKRAKSKKHKLNLFIGLLAFAILISTAFSFGWIFGIGFVIGFAFSIYNKTLEKKPLLPIFLFLAALVLRYALVNFAPSVLNSEGIIDFMISAFFLVVFIIIWWRLRKGNWKVWKK